MDLGERAFEFAIQVVQLVREIEATAPQALVEKILILGTEMGADIHEALATSSRRLALSKMTSARHASSEIGYWFKLLGATQILSLETVRPFLDEAFEINKAVTAICVKTHNELEREKDKD
jgi:four helix bundle protein